METEEKNLAVSVRKDNVSVPEAEWGGHRSR